MNRGIIGKIYATKDIENLDKYIPNKEAEKYFISQACRSITFEKEPSSVLKKNSPVLIASQYLSFINEGKKTFSSVTGHHFNYRMGPNETQWVLNKLATMPDYDTIIICVSCENHVKIAEALKNKGKNRYFVLTSPYHRDIVSKPH